MGRRTSSPLFQTLDTQDAMGYGSSLLEPSMRNHRLWLSTSLTHNLRVRDLEY
jgi:hypothetical protein